MNGLAREGVGKREFPVEEGVGKTVGFPGAWSMTVIFLPLK